MTERHMANERFYERLFADFWSTLDRSRLVTDEHSMFGDAHVFEWIIRSVRPETIIELGAWKGHSANFMIDCCRSEGLDNTRLVSIDTFLGGPEHWVGTCTDEGIATALAGLNRRNGMPTIIDAFLGNTIARGNEGRIFPFTADTSGAGAVMRALGFQADLIFIDAGHAYEQVVQEVHDYLPLLSERGVMFGDDYQFEPVARAVHDMAKHYGFGVAVISRKWIFVTQALMRHLMPAEVQIRSSYEGWVHP
jgi:hypothetical protein